MARVSVLLSLIILAVGGWMYYQRGVEVQRAKERELLALEAKQSAQAELDAQRRKAAAQEAGAALAAARKLQAMVALSALTHSRYADAVAEAVPALRAYLSSPESRLADAVFTNAMNSFLESHVAAVHVSALRIENRGPLLSALGLEGSKAIAKLPAVLPSSMPVYFFKDGGGHVNLDQVLESLWKETAAALGRAEASQPR